MMHNDFRGEVGLLRPDVESSLISDSASIKPKLMFTFLN